MAVLIDERRNFLYNDYKCRKNSVNFKLNEEVRVCRK